MIDYLNVDKKVTLSVLAYLSFLLIVVFELEMFARTDDRPSNDRPTGDRLFFAVFEAAEEYLVRP